MKLKVIIALVIGVCLNLFIFIPYIRLGMLELTKLASPDFAKTTMGAFGTQLGAAAIGAFICGAIVGFIAGESEVFFGAISYLIVFLIYLVISIFHTYSWWPVGWGFQAAAFKAFLLLIPLSGAAAGGNWPRVLRG